MPNGTASTITGTIVKADGTPFVGVILTFAIISGPAIFNAAIVASSSVAVTTDNNGQFSVQLIPGTYSVDTNNVDTYNIQVPDDGGSYDIEDIIVTPIPNITNTDQSQVWNVPKLAQVLGLTRSIIWNRGADPDAAMLQIAAFGNLDVVDSNSQRIAQMVSNVNPSLVLSLGNQRASSASSYDSIIGQLFHSYLNPYAGIYGAGAANPMTFAACIGNEDAGGVVGAGFSYAYYEAFFSGLPNNQRYYTFTKGSVQFFVLNSDKNEPDGYISTSLQGQWLQAQLAASTAAFKVVMFSDAPYSAHTGYNNTWMQWPFALWGASMVITGGPRTTEYHIVDNIPYLIIGSSTLTYDAGFRSDSTLQTSFSGSPAFLSIKVNGYKLVASAYAASGQTVFSVTLYSPNTAASLFASLLVDPSSPLSIGANGLTLARGNGLKQVKANTYYDYSKACIIVSATAPNVLADPSLANSLWCLPGSQAYFYAWNWQLNQWVPLPEMTNYSNGGGLTALAALTVTITGGNTPAAAFTITGATGGATVYYSIAGGAFQVYTGGTIAIPYGTDNVVAAYQTLAGNLPSPVATAQA